MIFSLVARAARSAIAPYQGMMVARARRARYLTFVLLLIAFACHAEIRNVGNEFQLYRDGVQYATVNAKCEAAEIRAYEKSNWSFVFFEVTPKVSAGKVGKVKFGPIKFVGTNPSTWALMGSGGLTNLSAKIGSAAFIATAEPKSRKGFVAAWLTDEWASGSVHSRGDGSFELLAEYGPMRSNGSQKDIFVVGAFDDCRLGLEMYGWAIANHYAIRLPKQESGFCTWYSDKGGYNERKGIAEKGACSESQTREFIDKVGETKLNRYGFDYYQIDDTWQAGIINPGPAKVFDRVDPKGPYPNGMKPTADYIRSHGFRAGLWYMPFSGEPKDEWWQDKSDLYVRVKLTGKPWYTVFGAAALDCSNPKTLALVRDIIGRITKEWGYRLIKFDGMYSGMGANLGGCGRWWSGDDLEDRVFADPYCSNAQAFRRGVAAMREGAAKDTQLLACNVAQNIRGMACSYGLVEHLRIGGDNGPIDTFPSRYLAGPIAASHRYFLNGRVWYNDPDPVYVRDAVPIGRARLMASWTSLGGMLYNFSDWLPWLSAERVEILKRTLAPHRLPNNVRPVDYFERSVHNVWKLALGNRAVFGLYNWNTNAAMKVDYDVAYCDLDPEKTYVGFDFWNDKFIPAFKGRFKFEVPADDCRVIAVHEVTDKPFVISTSRHVASPLIDVLIENWDAKTRQLSGVSKVVPNERYELRVYYGGEFRRFAFSPTSETFDWSIQL